MSFDNNSRLQPQGKPAAVRAEFDGVVDQVINDLGDIVLVGEGVYRVLRHIHVDIDMLVVYLLLKIHQHQSITLWTTP